MRRKQVAPNVTTTKTHQWYVREMGVTTLLGVKRPHSTLIGVRFRLPLNNTNNKTSGW